MVFLGGFRCRNSHFFFFFRFYQCGLIAEHAHSSRFGAGVHEKPYCRNCKTTDAVVMKVPFASKLLFRELQAMHITAKVEIETQ